MVYNILIHIDTYHILYYIYVHQIKHNVISLHYYYIIIMSSPAKRKTNTPPKKSSSPGAAWKNILSQDGIALKWYATCPSLYLWVFPCSRFLRKKSFMRLASLLYGLDYLVVYVDLKCLVCWSQHLFRFCTICVSS